MYFIHFLLINSDNYLPKLQTNVSVIEYIAVISACFLELLYWQYMDEWFHGLW